MTDSSLAVVRDPLDTLVVAQIAALRQHEADLKQQLVHSRCSENIASKLHSLRVRAERLNRMIDAMGVGGDFAEAVPAAIVA